MTTADTRDAASDLGLAAHTATEEAEEAVWTTGEDRRGWQEAGGEGQEAVGTAGKVKMIQGS